MSLPGAWGPQSGWPPRPTLCPRGQTGHEPPDSWATTTVPRPSTRSAPGRVPGLRGVSHFPGSGFPEAQAGPLEDSGPVQRVIDPPPSMTHPQIFTAGTRPLSCLEGRKGPASTSSHPQVVFLATGFLDDRSWQPSPADPRLHAQAQGAHARLPPSNPANNAEPLGSRHKAELSARSRCSPRTPAAVTTSLDLGSAAWGGLLSWVA